MKRTVIATIVFVLLSGIYPASERAISKTIAPSQNSNRSTCFPYATEGIDALIYDLRRLPVQPVTKEQKDDPRWLEKLDFSLPQDPGYIPSSPYSVIQMITKRTGHAPDGFIPPVCLDAFTLEKHVRPIFNVRRSLNPDSNKIEDLLYAIIPDFDLKYCAGPKTIDGGPAAQQQVPLYEAGSGFFIASDNHHLTTDHQGTCQPNSGVSCPLNNDTYCAHAGSKGYLFVRIASTSPSEIPSHSPHCQDLNTANGCYICADDGTILGHFVKDDGPFAVYPEHVDKTTDYWTDDANSGYTYAQAYLGILYETGQGGRQSNGEAYYWYSLAALGGDSGAGEQRDIVAAKLSPAQIAEEDARVKEWKPKTFSLRQGNGPRLGFGDHPRIPPHCTNSIPLEKLMERAQGGDPAAECALGDAYRMGKVGPSDLKMAEEWYQKSAAQNDTEAMVQLGEIYRGRQNYDEASKWFSRAAVLDSADAEFALGEMYMGGEGRTRDFGTAYFWLSLASHRIAFDLLERDKGLAQKQMSGEQAYAAAKSLKEWDSSPSSRARFAESSPTMTPEITKLMSMAKAGNTDAQLHLGTMYLTKSVLPSDPREGEKWIELAAEHGNAAAQRWLSGLLFSGGGTRIDKKAALEWLGKAAESGDESALFDIINRYKSGQDVPQDNHMVFEWTLVAGKRGLVWAYEKLAADYQDGIGTTQDWEKSYFWQGLARAHVSRCCTHLADPAEHLTAAQIKAIDLQISSWKPAQNSKLSPGADDAEHAPK